MDSDIESRDKILKVLDQSRRDGGGLVGFGEPHPSPTGWVNKLIVQ